MRHEVWQRIREQQLKQLEARLSQIPEGNPRANREALVLALVFIGIPIALMIYWAFTG